jgi:hypothetical protein
MKTDRNVVRKGAVRTDGGRSDVAHLTPGERIEMMWQLACDAWAFMGDDSHAESRLQRHVVRIRRGGR